MTEQRPSIDPALGLNLVQDRTLNRLSSPSVAIVIPAHNEQDTVAGVIKDCQQSLDLLHLSGESSSAPADALTTRSNGRKPPARR